MAQLIHAIPKSKYSMTAIGRTSASFAAGARHSSIYATTAHTGRRTSLLHRQSSSTATPKRPSPYRLIPLPTFLADFAPLHVKGWRLELLPGIRSTPTTEVEGMAQLQDRRLVRRYDFEQGKEGWRRLMAFTHSLGEAVEKEDVRLETTGNT